MLTAIFVVGLPGSGRLKWALSQVRLRRTQGLSCEVIHKPENLYTSLKDAADNSRKRPWHQVFVVADELCLLKNMDSVKRWCHDQGIEVETIYFQNNPKQCAANCMRSLELHEQPDDSDSALAKMLPAQRKRLREHIEKMSVQYLAPARSLPVLG